MNVNTLKMLEAKFMAVYPEGFENPELVKIGKKHRMPQLIQFAKESFDKQCFDNADELLESMIRMVSRSSMISVFEKPKFRDFARSLGSTQKQVLVTGLKELLHGSEELGFNMMLDVLEDGKLAKWTLISVFGAYYKPKNHVLIKPTTVKNIIRTLELKGVEYSPKPSYAFYKKYRALINKMKKEVDNSFCSSNAAFSGFLMMAMEL